MSIKSEHPSALRQSAEDPGVFDEVFTRFSRDLMVFFARRTFEPEAARDLMAETLAEAFRARHRFRGNSAAEEEAFVWAIARHQFSGWARRGRVEREAITRLGIQLEPLSDEQIAEVERTCGLGDLALSMSGHVQLLSARQRAALELRVVDGLPFAQVASRLGISEPTARARVSRALRQLARSVSADPSIQEHLA